MLGPPAHVERQGRLPHRGSHFRLFGLDRLDLHRQGVDVADRDQPIQVLQAELFPLGRRLAAAVRSDDVHPTDDALDAQGRELLVHLRNPSEVGEAMP